MRETPLEKVVVNRIIAKLKAAGVGWIVKTHGGPFQSAGIPDILCIAPLTGRFVGIEVKRAEGIKPTDLQQAQIQRINRAGGVAGVVFDEAGALRLLEMANGAVSG